MKAIAISKFKATCLSVLEQVRRTGEPILVTKRGEPIAEVVPASRTDDGQRELGSLEGSIEYHGDLVAPVVSPDEWEALR